jgi:hypothetical protein
VNQKKHSSEIGFGVFFKRIQSLITKVQNSTTSNACGGDACDLASSQLGLTTLKDETPASILLNCTRRENSSQVNFEAFS